MHTQESGKGMKKLRNNKIRKLLAFMVALALMVSCMPSAYTISASEAFGGGTEDIFTDGEFTSEPAAEESTPDVSSADQEETEQAQQSTLTYEIDSVKVTAEALEDGALPQNTALKADGVNENSSVSYDTVSQKLSAAATDKGSSLRGFFAYDVYFADGDGNRVEPNGRVRVTFEYKTPAAPELTDAASTSVTVEKLHYNSSTGDTDVNTLQANEDLKVLNVNEGKQIQTLQVETGNAAVFAVMWDSPETADVEAEAVSGNEDEVSIASEELTDGMDISDEPEQDAAETPAAENPEVTPDAEPSEAPAENPDAEPTEAPAEDPDVVEEPAEDIASPEDVPAADENGETSLIEVLGDDTNLRVSPSTEAEVLATVNAGTQLTLLDTVTAEDGATWYKVSWEGTEAYIRSDMAQVVDSSDEAEEPEDVQEEEIQPEITRYDYKSDEVNVKVTLTDPADLPDNAELSVTPVELSQEAEDQITEEAIKEKKAIEKIHSYDIKFLVDGEEVQPGASVKVSVSLNDEKKIKDADVYHVDENDNVENMDGSVAKNGDVEFETTHFSTYVIVGNKRDDKIKVTIEHYNATTGEKIYADDVDKELSVGQKIDCKKATNWDITRVDVVKNETTTTVNEGDIELAQDATVKVYYTPTTGTFAGAPTFYDYTVQAGESRNTYYSINMPDNYTDQTSNRFAVGGGDNYDVYKRGLYSWTKDNKAVNSWTSPNGVTITGLITGLNSDGSVKFSCADPGLFDNTDKKVTVSNQERYLRRVYKDYTLNFTRTGDTYLLSGIKDGNNKDVTENYNGTTGYNFFPLDDVKVNYEGAKTSVAAGETSDKNVVAGNHNYYFGMRYDVKFSIGDYVGPLNYTFKGDDDMWVLLDGKKVVIDLGGIHNAVEGSVNLWGHLKQGDATTHTLTILYMERGAGASNCYMNFTLPNATISQVTTDALGTLNFQKVNKEGAGLSGARFALYNDEECTTQIATATSDDDGNVTFDKLRAGTYYLKEIQAPVGYVASNEKWTVTVTKENDKVTTTLKNSSGTAVKDKKILNETPEEIIKSSMESNKTATVKDWDKRTYDINITAASTSTSTITTTEKAVADIMLVLDASGSMDEKIVSYSYVAENTTDGRDGLNTGTPYYVKKDESYVKLQHYDNYYGRTGWYIGDDWWSQTKADDSTYNGCKIYLKKTEKKLTALQNAVKQFITDTANKSPDSKIGITAFSSVGYGSHGKTEDLQKAGDNKENLTKFVDSLAANGGTDPYVGLNNAKSKLDAATMSGDTKPKYVLLFTDGEPTGSGNSWNTTAQQNAENITNGTESIKGIKQEGYTVYTIGFGLQDKAKAFLAGGTYSNTTYPGIASPNCAFNVENATQLGDIFKDIQNTITQDISITGATITDIIDPRFELLKDDGTSFTDVELAALKSGTPCTVNGGTVSWVDGNYQIQWTDQTIPNKKNDTWNKTITVRAKDEFIGGNNVTTNVSPGSKISTKYGYVTLPQPKVNVKSDLVVNNNEKTIFYGDTVPTENDILNVLFNKTQPQGYVTQLDGTKKLVTYTMRADGQSFSENDFTLTWYKDEACTKEIKVEDMAKVVPEPDSKQYYLKVTYNVGQSSDESNANTTKKNKNGEDVTYISGKSNGSGVLVLTAHNSQDDKTREYGVYTIKIITGQIQIIKKLETAAKEEVKFTFDVTNEAGTKIATATATIKAGDTEGTVTLKLENGVKEKISKDNTSILTRLARGEYTVTETPNSNYTLKDLVAGNTTNCKNEVVLADRQIKFSIGTDKDNKTVLKGENTYTINGRIGVAEFTNEKSVADVKLVKVDAADTNVTIKGAKFALYEAKEDWSKASENPINADIVSGDNGRINLNAIPVGSYLLEETEAATGYSLPTNPWRITVEGGGVVTVMDGNGHDVENVSENGTTIYQITNTKVYSLPESGGPGTYGFTISGVAILATALLLFINNKRREEEAKRS